MPGSVYTLGNKSNFSVPLDHRPQTIQESLTKQNYEINFKDNASKHRNPFTNIPVYDYQGFIEKTYNEIEVLRDDVSFRERKKTRPSFETRESDEESMISVESLESDEEEEERPVTPVSKLAEIASQIGLNLVPEKGPTFHSKYAFVPSTRKKRWPGVQLPKPGRKRLNKNQTLKQRILTIWNVAYAIRKKIEEVEIAEADMDLDPEPYKEEPETEDEEDTIYMLNKLRNLWWKMCKDEDLPVDVQLADQYVRENMKASENSPMHIQREIQLTKDFQDYLDNHGVSELIIGILMMLYTKPCYPEGAKELLRLGLGGKPTEVATAADVLKEIEEAQERISELEGDLNDYRIQVLRLLKEEAFEEPEDPTANRTPVRRMEYVLKAFQCRSRPSDVEFEEIYDLSEIPALAKYKIKLPKDYEALGRELVVGLSPTKTECGVNTKKWIFGAPLRLSETSLLNR